MSKKLKQEPIYFVPGIFGWFDNNYTQHVLNKVSTTELNPYNLNHKIIIYERQVKEWFLKPETTLSYQKIKAYCFDNMLILN